ncbi:MOSC and FAD-binding oxidoreductase domain-containing protein [Amycolatopsis rhabdoformis]|uniref:MOSC and FAD-binding oxidoreductase domain-containing protein n=1 Tax=Amycolatopsis rhabdoformis TaxID=1448059 RepID=A0ABZ1HVL9_9PSEU|nr:MOSC and FAD-binding oxidoreductase domain-containing protein [Amycolatopsis rhabdoformis]WSE26326.1 MOSC and FAD-binding oxidoreductase domain-containing protein [Amycolatopsis rhabdoformis]
MTATVLAVNVGMPKNVSWQGKTVYTGVWKHPVEGPAMVRRLNIDGDGQGDKAGHGGEQRAVFVYQIDSYRHWEQHFGREGFEYGSFGENFTVDGLPDHEVCIGDRYRIGEAEFEVTQPRVTCYRVGMRLGEPELPSLLVSHHRPGFYFRVIREGKVSAGDRIVKTRTGPGALSVADTDALLYLPDKDEAKLHVAAGIPALSPGWRQSFEQLLGTAAPEAAPAWAGFRPLRVTAVRPESTSVTSVYLEAEDGAELPAALPGQYLTLRVPAAASPVRSYSISSAPGTAGYRISVKREGVASTYLTTELAAGAVLDVAAPRGDFVLGAGTSPVLLVSAGIGVTPVLAMLHQLAAQGSSRPVWWIHGARGPAEHPLAAEAARLLATLPGGRSDIFFSAATADERVAVGAHAGRLTKDALVQLGVPADASAYLCGPAAFMTDMTAALTAAGLDASCIHTELFGALDAINPGLVGQPARPPHQPEGPPGTGPTVTFARSGVSAPFPGGTLLEFAEACDVPTRYACRSGVCHTCVTPVLSGSVDYSPSPLEPPAAGQTLVCCATPHTDLVLDM